MSVLGSSRKKYSKYNTLGRENNIIKNVVEDRERNHNSHSVPAARRNNNVFATNEHDDKNTIEKEVQEKTILQKLDYSNTSPYNRSLNSSPNIKANDNMRYSQPILNSLSTTNIYNGASTDRDDYSQRYNNSRKSLEGSWDKLVRDPKTDLKTKKNLELQWKEELAIQMQQQMYKKMKEKEQQKQQERMDELRVRRELEEMNFQMNKEIELRKFRDERLTRYRRDIPKELLANPPKDLNNGKQKTENETEISTLPNETTQQPKFLPVYDVYNRTNAKIYDNPEEDSQFLKSTSIKPIASKYLNSYIDNLKSEILDTRKNFLSELRDLRVNPTQQRFRNLAEKNILPQESSYPVVKEYYIEENASPSKYEIQISKSEEPPEENESPQEHNDDGGDDQQYIGEPMKPNIANPIKMIEKKDYLFKDMNLKQIPEIEEEYQTANNSHSMAQTFIDAAQESVELQNVTERNNIENSPKSSYEIDKKSFHNQLNVSKDSQISKDEFNESKIQIQEETPKPKQTEKLKWNDQKVFELFKNPEKTMVDTLNLEMLERLIEEEVNKSRLQTSFSEEKKENKNGPKLTDSSKRLRESQVKDSLEYESPIEKKLANDPILKLDYMINLLFRANGGK